MARRIALYDCHRCPESLPEHALAAHAEMHARDDRDEYGNKPRSTNPRKEHD